MRKIMIIFIPAILALIFGCQQPLNQTKVVEMVKLSNGTVITPEEKAELDAMKPQVDLLVTDVTGYDMATLATNGKSVSAEQMSKIKLGIKTLLQNQFGNDYQKFIIEKEISRPGISNSVLKNIRMNTSLYQQVGYSEKTITNPCGYQTTIHYYGLIIGAYTYSSPYYSYNYATQEPIDDVSIKGYNIISGSFASEYYVPFIADCHSLQIIDDDVVDISTENSTGQKIVVIGKIVWGYYPNTASIDTYHYVIDPRVYNGQKRFVLNWSVY